MMSSIYSSSCMYTWEISKSFMDKFYGTYEWTKNLLSEKNTHILLLIIIITTHTYLINKHKKNKIKQ